MFAAIYNLLACSLASNSNVWVSVAIFSASANNYDYKSAASYYLFKFSESSKFISAAFSWVEINEFDNIHDGHP